MAVHWCHPNLKPPGLQPPLAQGNQSGWFLQRGFPSGSRAEQNTESLPSPGMYCAPVMNLYMQISTFVTYPYSKCKFEVPDVGGDFFKFLFYFMSIFKCIYILWFIPWKDIETVNHLGEQNKVKTCIFCLLY